MTRPRILVITQMYPSGSTGTSVKTLHTLRVLEQKGFSIDIVCPHYSKMVKIPLSSPHIRIYAFEKQTISKMSASYMLRVWRVLLSWKPFRVAKLHDRSIEQKINTLMHLHTYEFIFFDGFSTIQYAKHLDSKHIYIDDEDITDLLWKRVNTKGNIFLQVFYIVEWVKCMVYERIYFLRMARIWAISPNTRHRLRQLTKARTVCMPTIIPLQRSAFRATSRHLVFSGLLSWQENVVGLRWFLKECWPSIHADFPNTKLYITGQMADPMIVQDAHTIPGVELVGFVTSLKDVYTRCAIAIAPIFINSGIKVKVLTYLSFGLPTVSSKEAWLGMSSTAGLIITDKRTFTDAVKKLLLDTDMRINLSKQGTNNIRTNHSKDALLAFFRSEKII